MLTKSRTSRPKFGAGLEEVLQADLGDLPAIDENGHANHDIEGQCAAVDQAVRPWGGVSFGSSSRIFSRQRALIKSTRMITTAIGPQGGRVFLVAAHADGFDDEKADAAAGHKPDHGGRAHIDIPAQQGVSQEGGDDLGDDGKADGLDQVGAGGGDRFDRALIDMLDLFGEQLAQGGDRMDRQGDDAGKGAQPDPDDDDQTPDDGIDRAHEVQDPARRRNKSPSRPVHARHDVVRGQEADRDGQDGGEDGRQQADGNGFDQ